MATARIEIELTGDREAQAALQQLERSEQRLTRSNRELATAAEQSARSTTKLSRAQAVARGRTDATAASTGRLTRAQQEAATKAVLLGQQIGVTLPTAMQRVIVRSQVMATAIQAAFGVGALVFFGSAIATVLIPRLRDAVRWLREQNDRFNEQKQLQQDLAVSVGRHGESLTELRRRYQEVGLEGEKLLQLRRRFLVADLEEARRKRALIDLELEQINATIAERRAIAERVGGHAVITPKEQEQISGLLSKQAEATQALEILRQSLKNFDRETAVASSSASGFRSELRSWEETIVQAHLALADKLVPTLKRVGELTREEQMLLQQLPLRAPRGPNLIDPQPQLQFLKQIENAERDLAILRAGLAGDTVTQILLQEQARVEATIQAAQEMGATEENLQRLRQTLNEQTNLRIAEVHKQNFERMTGQVEAFFDRVFLTARSFGDVWRQLWTQLVGFFTRQVARMVAAWIAGQRTMASASAGRSFFGSIFGALGSFFGFGAGGSAADRNTVAAQATGVPSTIPTNAALAHTGTLPLPSAARIGTQVQLSSGFGATGAGGAALPAAGAAARKLSVANLLNSLGPSGLLLAAGLSGFGGPGRGALSGAALGALGFGLAGVASGFTFSSTLLGLLTAPVGIATLGIGALAGFLIGIFNRGRKKRESTRVLLEVIGGWEKTKEAYEKFQIDLAGATQQSVQLWEEAVVFWKRQGDSAAKKYIRQRDRRLGGHLKELEAIEKQREARAQLPAFGLVPEFAAGGPVRAVHSPGGKVWGLLREPGAVPAIVHAGEYVQPARAVRRAGLEAMEALRREDLRGAARLLERRAVLAGLGSEKELQAMSLLLARGPERAAAGGGMQSFAQGGLVTPASPPAAGAQRTPVIQNMKVEMNFNGVTAADAELIWNQFVRKMNSQFAGKGIRLRFR